MLTLSDYQQEALKTASEVNTLEYCVLGLVNEAGEVAGVVKKWLRGDYDEATMREKMGKELGDVLWYVAVTADRSCFSVSLQEYELYSEVDMYIQPSVSLGVRQLARAASRVSGTYDNGGSLESPLFHVMNRLTDLCESCGHTLESIARANIEKLRDRQKRGVLHGSGDER